MSKKTEGEASRRDFLKLATVSAPAAVAAATLTGEKAEAATVDADGSPRLQDTAHTRHYFETARF